MVRTVDNSPMTLQSRCSCAVNLRLLGIVGYNRQAQYLLFSPLTSSIHLFTGKLLMDCSYCDNFT